MALRYHLIFRKNCIESVLLGLVRDALACDVAAADGTLRDTELRMLEEVRHELNVSRLHAAAIEQGARARHQRA